MEENNTQIKNTEAFPRTFWTANVTELIERAAYYAMASFVVLYLGRLGLGDYWPSTLNGILWFLVFFLPILSGTIADEIGFKKSLLGAFVLLAIGYFIMGYPVWFGGATLLAKGSSEITSGYDIIIPVIGAIILIGIGGSVIKPCISGTIQKTSGSRATLGFGIFYMIINVGSLLGRGISYIARKEFDLSYIFAVSVAASIFAFFVVLFFYNEPEQEIKDKTKKTVAKILLDMVLVLRNLRFAVFLLVISGFWFVYAQVYNVLPKYLEMVVEIDPAVDIYTMTNPFVIVFFQLLVIRLFGKLKPIKSIIIGGIIIGLSMLINLVPILLYGNIREGVNLFWVTIPIGSLFIVLTVALIAFGELFAAARQFEFIGALAPKGKEGLFLGYANLPMAIGALIGGPAGAAILNEIMCKNSIMLENGLLELDPFWNSLGWIILMGIGIASAFFMWLYNRWIQKNPLK
ncbi:MAG: MFS transporter [Bacteroidales bacterium]|nr:MFS transporter [Bacteroidales bacterium]